MPRLDLEASLIVPIINRKQTSAFLLLADVTADSAILNMSFIPVATGKEGSLGITAKRPCILYPQ
jgi:hypothetical protein